MTAPPILAAARTGQHQAGDPLADVADRQLHLLDGLFAACPAELPELAIRIIPSLVPA